MGQSGWLFGDESSLLVAMKSGLIPEEVQGQAVRFWRTEEGAVGVCPMGSTPRSMSAALKGAGVARVELPEQTSEARLWPALLSTARQPEEQEDSLVLFALSEPSNLLPLLGELVRLGCDRCAFRILQGSEEESLALVRVYDPPYFTVAQASDPAMPHQVFVPALAGQESLWIERGCSHPALLGLLTQSDSLELIGADGRWRALPPGSWTDVSEILDVKLPTGGADYSACASSERLRIPLRFSKTRRDASASLWVVPEEGQQLLEGLLGSMPDDVIERLLFAMVSAGDGPPVLLLRARPGRGAPPQLAVGVQGFVPLMGIGNLYLPTSAGLEPPLRRDTLRERLAPDPDRVYWLSERADRELSLDSVAESDFCPLSEWADYVIHGASEVLSSWLRASVFEFSSFQSTGREWNEAAAPAPAPERSRGARSKSAKSESASSEAPAASTAVQSGEPRTEPLATAKAQKSRLGAGERELAALEEQFLALDAPADDPERVSLWAQMAAAHTTLKNQRDATLCWTRAIWESEGKEAIELVRSWLEAEESMNGQLSSYRIGASQVRLAIANCLHASLSGKQVDRAVRDRLGRALDAHEESLDVRTLWLARTAMSRAVGGDSLMLARSRDSLLHRLREGLSIANDVPTFLRFAGGAGGDRQAVQQLASNLEALWKHYQKAKRKRSPVEAAEEKTRALVGLQFAFGFASLGLLERARELRDTCIGALDAADSIDHFLSRAYSARIDQALAGDKRVTALPPTIAATLDALPKLDRYKIDRLRSASTILEPQERLDPMQTFQRGGDSRGEEFEGLRGLEEPGLVVQAIRKILDQAESGDTSLEDRARLLDGVMDFFPLVPEADAVPALRRVLAAAATTPPGSRALLLEEAMSLTGFFGRDAMTRDIATELGALVNELPSDQAASLASEFGSCLRSMRRVGLAEQAGELLRRLGAMTVGETPERIEARLHVAAGQAYVGDFERARVVLVATQAVLSELQLTGKDRLSIARALAMAWRHAPREQAMSGLMDLAAQLSLITDSFNTNSHFCLSVVSFMDAMVLALASGELAMGELGRRWLDEDEYLVRRRIHREMGAT